MSSSSSSSISNGIATCFSNFQRNPMASMKDLGRVALFGAIFTAGAVFCGVNAIREIGARGFTKHSGDLGAMSLALLASSGLCVYLTFARFCEREVEENKELLAVFEDGPEMEVQDDLSSEYEYEVTASEDFSDEETDEI